MGIGLFRNCDTNFLPNVPAPNPNPKRWKLLSYWVYENSYVLKVLYLDATNFEGIKIMVYKGKFPGVDELNYLDPHFTEYPSSPIARFRPDTEGIKLATGLAALL